MNNHQWAFLIIEELLRHDAAVFCISPGSRSTPLTLAVAQNPRARAVIHYDERGAAFFALGHAKATGKPAVLVCTSGTAAANYLPAVVEASASCIPLILLTADRPPELLDCGANQAVDQVNLYGSYVRWQFNLPCPGDPIPPETVLTAIDHAAYRATGTHAGPVHINCMFREPLYDANMAAEPPNIARNWKTTPKPYTRYLDARMCTTQQTLVQVEQDFAGSKRGLLVVGNLPGASEAAAVKELAKAVRWPVLADIGSGLRLDPDVCGAVHYYDQMLVSERGQELLEPEVIIQIGARLVSKRLQQFLARQTREKNVPHLLVAQAPSRLDPDHVLGARIESDIVGFCSQLLPLKWARAEGAWLAQLRQASEVVEHAIAESFVDNEISEPAVARAISTMLPEGSCLFLGNSMPIRDMDMYGRATAASKTVVVNRGASGIDGNLATAAGFACGAQKPITAVVGDLAFLHDMNSLALFANATQPVVVVVINNDGGGIFSFLPVAEENAHFEKFWGTPHGYDFAATATQFGFDYCRPADMDAFQAVYEIALDGGKTIMEVKTTRGDNLRFHQAIQTKVCATLDAIKEK
jgi:2-succinyl-5-enolpyruvyl-6-hydroxy-3-cyclohexene-1-carboxylate synthase